MEDHATCEHDAHVAHDRHAGHSVAMFRDKFWISLLLTRPTLIWGHMLQGVLRFEAPRFADSQWTRAVSGTAVFVYGGRPFLVGARRELQDRLPGMMTLIARHQRRLRLQLRRHTRLSQHAALGGAGGNRLRGRHTSSDWLRRVELTHPLAV